MDLDVLSIKELTGLGLTQLQARKYHVAVQKALGDEELVAARRESQALLFETASSLRLVNPGAGVGSPSKNPASRAVRGPAQPLPPPPPALRHPVDGHPAAQTR